MKQFALTTCIRRIWIMSGWLRQEAAIAAGMLVVQRHQVELREEEEVKVEQQVAASGGEVGVDSQGRLRRVRMLDDYILPFECGMWFLIRSSRSSIWFCPLAGVLSYFRFLEYFAVCALGVQNCNVVGLLQKPHIQILVWPT